MSAPEPATGRTPRVAAARRLTRASGRAQAGQFLAEGPAAVREALAVAGAVSDLFVTAAARDRFTELLAGAAGIRTTVITDEAAVALSETVTPQGLIALCRTPHHGIEEVTAGRPRLVAVLAEIRDPGNAGTMLRTASAVGADAVVLAGDCVDPYNGKSVRASAGAIFHLPVVRGISLDEATKALHRAGLQILAADGGAPHSLDDLEADGGLARATAWVFGNEAHGLPAATRAGVRVRIPMSARAESLNVGAAAAICLYASARAQRAGNPQHGKGRPG